MQACELPASGRAAVGLVSCNRAPWHLDRLGLRRPRVYPRGGQLPRRSPYARRRPSCRSSKPTVTAIMEQPSRPLVRKWTTGDSMPDFGPLGSFLDKSQQGSDGFRAQTASTCSSCSRSVPMSAFTTPTVVDWGDDVHRDVKDQVVSDLRTMLGNHPDREVLFADQEGMDVGRLEVCVALLAVHLLPALHGRGTLYRLL
jgi:hypothetical protein